jgi:hypothetical protein
VREFDLYIPLYYNDGAPVEPKKFQDLQRRLLDQFGGLTFFPQPNQGFWTVGNVTYRDEIVIYRVVTKKARAARRFFAKPKEQFKKTFRQGDIFIVERRVKVY